MARNSLTSFRPGGLMSSGFADPFLSLHRDMNRLFEDVLRSGGLSPSAGDTQGVGLIPPPMDVSETDGELVLKAEMPGVSEADVEVTLNDDVLTLRAEKKIEHDEERQDYHFTERSFGTFQRSLRLPYQVEPDQVNASFENGVLTIRLPKSQPQQRSRKIEVQGASAGTKRSRIESNQSSRDGGQAASQGRPSSSGSASASKPAGASSGGSDARHNS
jgi:HSP20 family protein